MNVRSFIASVKPGRQILLRAAITLSQGLAPRPNLLDKLAEFQRLPLRLGSGSLRTLNEGRVIGPELSFTN